MLKRTPILPEKRFVECPHWPGRDGLSLIELVMVVMVIGILTAIAAPRLSNQLNIHSLEAAKSLLQADLIAAREEALMTSSPVTITVSRQSHTYSVTAQRNGAPAILRTVNLSESPWQCRIVSLARGTTRTLADSCTLMVNGAGVFAEDLVIGLAAGESLARVSVQAGTGRILLE